MANIENLKKEVDIIKNSLNELKNNVSLSDAEKKNKAEALKSKAETTKQKIQNEIHSLENKTDNESKKKKEQAETLLNSFNETMKLYESILNSSESKEKKQEKKKKEDKKEKGGEKEWDEDDEDEEKWILWKTWEWIWEQWSDVTSWDKRKEEPWKNVLRAVWFWVTWYAIYKWVKKLWNRAFWDDDKDKSKKEDEEKKKDEDKSFWDKPVWKFIKWAWVVLWIWSWIYYVAHGLYTKNRWLRDLLDWEKGKKLDFDEAMEYSKWAIANQDNKEGMSYGMDLKYNESTWEIEAYWEKIKIDKDKRKIEWLNVEFKKYEHMISAAILTAYLKKNYSWKCTNNNPFYLNWDWQWDVNVSTWNGSEEAADWTWNWGRIVGVTAGWIAWILAWIYGWLKAWVAVWISGWVVWYGAGQAYDTNNILHDLMPELDDDYWKKNFAWYLNKMDCRKARNQTEEEVTESPIKEEIVECMNEIQDTNKELAERWWNRKLDAIQDPNDEKKYTIKAYGRDFSAEVTWDKWNRKIRIMWISGWNPSINTDMEKSGISNLELPLKEWCYMSCFLGFILSNNDIIQKWVEYPRFEYKSRWLWIKKWIYFNNATTISTDYDTRLLTEEKFKSRMPTLFQEKNRNKFIEFLNDWITDDSNISIWKKPK